jgi:hypothetical protein
LKNHKSNLTVEVLSDKVDVYRIFKGDIFNLFGGISGKVPEMLRSIDTTQQIHSQIKLAYLEENVESNRFDLISKLQFIESTSLQPSKPKLIDENKLNNPLKDAYKVVETKVNSKINDLKASLIPNKAKGLSSLKSIENAGTLRATMKNDINNAPVTSNAPVTNVSNLQNQSIVPGLGVNEKKPSINDSIQNKLNNAKASLSGLTSNQLASKNKLQSIIGKSSKQSQEEVDEAFKRINDRKKGDGIGSKLLSGLDKFTESVSLDVLTKKLDTKDLKSEKVSESTIEQSTVPESNRLSSNEVIKESEQSLSQKSSNNNVNNVTEVEDVAKKLESLILDNLVDSVSLKEEYQKNYTGNISARQNELGGSSIQCDDEKLLRSFMKKKSSKVFPLKK